MRKILLFMVASVIMHAQNGTLDVAFNNTVNNGFNNSVYDIEVLSSGKFLVCGSHASFNGADTRGLTRVNNDGTVDASFNPGGIGANYSPINDIQVLSSGKILAGGFFSKYNNVTVNNLCRVNSDGTLDTTFSYANTYSIAPNAIAVRPDGKIYIGGNSPSGRRFTRLNADGSDDVSFNPGTGFNASPQAIALQPDGKILVAGQYTSYNGITAKGLIRLNEDGSVDASFNTGAGFYYLSYIDANFSALTLQNDGKIYVGGSFQTYDGAPATGFIRLNADGTRETTFNVGTGLGNTGPMPTVSSILLQPDGKVLITGTFTSFNGLANRCIIRLNPDGTLDSSINFGTGIDYNGARKTALQNDGQIVLIGDFSTYKSVQIKGKIFRITNTVLSTDEINTSSDIAFYPNPVENTLHIRARKRLDHYQVFNTEGRLVKSGEFSGSNYDVQMQGIASGIYYIKIQGKNFDKTLKIVKK